MFQVSPYLGSPETKIRMLAGCNVTWRLGQKICFHVPSGHWHLFDLRL